MSIHYLSYDQRKTLEALYAENVKIDSIAARLGVNQVTIYRELKRGETGTLDNNGRMAYSATLGQKTVNENFRRRGNRKSVTNAQRRGRATAQNIGSYSADAAQLRLGTKE